jgi:hypothetical protein
MFGSCNYIAIYVVARVIYSVSDNYFPSQGCRRIRLSLRCVTTTALTTSARVAQGKASIRMYTVGEIIQYLYGAVPLEKSNSTGHEISRRL